MLISKIIAGAVLFFTATSLVMCAAAEEGSFGESDVAAPKSATAENCLSYFNDEVPWPKQGTLPRGQFRSTWFDLGDGWDRPQPERSHHLGAGTAAELSGRLMDVQRQIAENQRRIEALQAAQRRDLWMLQQYGIDKRGNPATLFIHQQ